MNKTTIYLNNLELKTFTESNASDYCILNNLNPDNITRLYLYNNELTDISGIKLFKNLEILELCHNQITDISALNNLKKLEILSLENNQIKDISVLKNLKKLENLFIGNNTKIKDISVIQYLKNLIILGIRDLELESDQIEYIKKLNKLEKIWYKNGFKDMSVLNQLNKDIKIII